MKRVLVVIAIAAAAIVAFVLLSSRQKPEQAAAAPPPQAPRAEAAPAPAPAPSPATATEPPTAAAAPAAPEPAPVAAPAPAPAQRRRTIAAARPPRAAAAPATAPASPRSAAAVSAAAIAEASVQSTPAARAGLSGAIAGSVADAAGRPIPGATVLAVAPDGSDGFETFADDDGEFVLPGLRPGRYAVFAGLGTPLGARLGGRTARVGSATVTRVQLREPADAAPVRVAAVDAAGRPVVGEAILVPSRTGDHGTFASVLASDAIWFPAARGSRSDLRVPPGTYTVVMLQGAGTPARAARDPIVVKGAPLDVNVQLADAR